MALRGHFHMPPIRSSRVRNSLATMIVTMGLLMPVGAAATDTVVVLLDQAKIVKLAPGAQTIIVGNPGIADVTVQKNGVLIVTGKSYGVTNVIALDAEG